MQLQAEGKGTEALKSTANSRLDRHGGGGGGGGRRSPKVPGRNLMGKEAREMRGSDSLPVTRQG